MNVSELPFDTEQMIAGLKLWVETESPSTDPVAVNKVIDLATYELASMGASIQRIPGRMGFGDTLRATIKSRKDPQPGVLICCHADTVHAIGSKDNLGYRREGNKLWGPGILGMKAGIFICIEAMKKLRLAEWEQNLPVTLLVVPDKEVGCPSTRELIEATARSNKYVLIPEPATSDGGVCLGRHSVIRYSLDVKKNVVEGLVDSGRDSGAEPRSAITEMAKHLIAIEDMSTDGCSFTVSAVQSEDSVNFASKCTAEVISEARTRDDTADSSGKMFALNSPNPDLGLHVSRTVSLPLWEPDAASRALFNVAKDAGSELGVNLLASASGGGSVGNITGAMGIATLDGLGARGFGLRSQAEHIEIDSLVERAKLMAALLLKLA